MLISNKLYDILKWITLIGLPGLGTAYFGLAGIWHLPYAQEIAATIIILVTLLGGYIGVTTLKYNAENS